MNEVKNYSKEEQLIAVDILLLAFSSDPFQRYLMPDPSIFFKNSTIWFNNAASQSISTKSLFGTEDIQVLLFGSRLIMLLNLMLLARHFKTSAKSQKNIFQYFNELQKNRPKDAWYLEYAGVDPSKQSLGLGSTLLKNSLLEIDDLHQPAYLESSNPRNMSLYERHGFETVTKIQFGDGPPMHTMYREAR